jgi:hypothetical protein
VTCRTALRASVPRPWWNPPEPLATVRQTGSSHVLSIMHWELVRFMPRQRRLVHVCEVQGRAKNLVTHRRNIRPGGMMKSENKWKTPAPFCVLSTPSAIPRPG